MRNIAEGLRNRIQNRLIHSLPIRNRWVRLSGGPGFVFRTHGAADRYISTVILKYGCWEPELTDVLSALLRADADFIDIGANIGWHSIVAAHRLGGRGQVHSFEPEQANVALLRVNVALSGLSNVVVNPWALSDAAQAGTLSLHPNNLGDHRLGTLDDRQAVTVEMRRLDDYAIDPARPLLIKLDVQGGEWHVLKGAQQMLARDREVVIACEVSPLLLAEQGSSLEALIALLAANGFEAALNGTLPLQPISWEALWDLLRPDRLTYADAGRDIIAYRRRDGMMRGMLAS